MSNDTFLSDITNNTTITNTTASIDFEIDLIAGILFVFFGFFGAIFVGFVLCSMQLVKAARQGSHFYHLSSCCLFCDLTCLILVGVYFGTVIITKKLTGLINLPGQDFLASLFAFFWPLKGCFLALVAWTRLVSVKSTTIVVTKTSTVQKIISISVLTSTVIGAIAMSYSNCLVLKFSADQLTLVLLNQSERGCSQILIAVTNIFDYCNCIILIVINVATVILYHKKPNFPPTNTQMVAKFGREKKLFVQCAVSTCFYLFASAVFIVTGVLTGHMTLVCHAVFSLVDMMVFLDTGIVYVVLNKELRHEMRHFSVKKLIWQQNAQLHQPTNTNGGGGWLSGLQN